MLVVFRCLKLKEAFPPGNPLLCKKPAYCCKYDHCNTDDIYRENLTKVPQATTTGKRCALRVWSYDYADLGLFDVLLES